MNLSEQAWNRVTDCPLCGEEVCGDIGPLPGNSYRFGLERIPFPASGITMAHCPQCSLYFKRTIPVPEFLATVITRQIEHIWTLSCDFSIEKELISATISDSSFDMLDIGASRGELLTSFADRGGRRSALDIVIYSGLSDHLRGEFIQGFIDNAQIDWSHAPYDLLTVFDVLEHLYDPQAAFRNLVAMVKRGGYVVIETGDVQSAWARRYGVQCWYYAGVFEHHLFWSEKSLRYAATRHGLKVIRLLRKRHKYVRAFPYSMKLKLAAKTLLYRLSPALYHRISRVGFDVQPASPFVRDHLFATLHREE